MALVRGVPATGMYYALSEEAFPRRVTAHGRSPESLPSATVSPGFRAIARPALGRRLRGLLRRFSASVRIAVVAEERGPARVASGSPSYRPERHPTLPDRSRRCWRPERISLA